MPIFVTGTGTDVGKTIVSSWLCVHSGFSYVKPIQAGEYRDSDTVFRLSNTTVYPETHHFKTPASPNLAASYEGKVIRLDDIALPKVHNLIIEGAGGILVPLNAQDLMIDLIKHLKAPVILVASCVLGTINHTLLSLEALLTRKIPVLGIIMNGEKNTDVFETIENFSRMKILAHLPTLSTLNQKSLEDIPCSLNFFQHTANIK